MDTATREVVPLTAADRCDQCGAQAYIRAEYPVGVLLFCTHHGRKHWDALVASGASDIIDQSGRG